MVNTKKNSPGNIRIRSLADGKRVRRPERAPGPGLKRQASSVKPQAPSDSSSKQQASSPKRQASSFKPQATSLVIREPRYM
jgi:hypothetical protein